MNFDIDTLATYPTLLFCMGVYILVLLVRRIVEAIAPQVKPQPWWSLVLFVAPPVTGVLLGLFLTASYPYPAGIAHWKSRVLYGLVCGFIASYVYKIALSVVRKLWPGVLPENVGEKSPLPPLVGAPDDGDGSSPPSP